MPITECMTAINKKYNTPNMERFAKEGMKFTNAYANSVFSPLSVSLLTGMSKSLQLQAFYFRLYCANVKSICIVS